MSWRMLYPDKDDPDTVSPFTRRGAFLALAIAMAVFACAAREALAQDACRTANCAAAGSTPAQCQKRAAPYTMQVNFVGTSLATYAFSPNKPKIEEGDCIRWSQSNTITFHDSTRSACNDDEMCAFAPAPLPACTWDTGNVSPTAPNNSRTCFYAPPSFTGSTGATGLHYYCRLHASPNDTTGMVGDLRVTTKIVLTVHKSGNIVQLSWVGGGVTGSFTYDVLRSLNNVSFTAFSTLATGAIPGNAFNDSTTIVGPALYSYLIRNKNT